MERAGWMPTRADDTLMIGGPIGRYVGVGAQIGTYELESEIGRGGMARVFRARQASLSRTVALKVLAPDLAHDATFAMRFRQEAMIAAALEHPNIVPIYDVGEVGGQLYIAMRFVGGHSLADVLAHTGPLPMGRAQALLSQVASALDYAHARGVVHRDLKPANILVDDNDHVSLVDFGIARAVDSTRLTRVGQVAGTPSYMSPEQVRGEEVDFRSDLYSLGILAFELLSGKTPFRADSDVAILHQHVYDPPPPLRSVRRDAPASAEQAVQRMLAKRPEERFPSAFAFVAALTNPALAVVGQRPERRSSTLVWLPAAGAVVVLAGAAWLTLRPTPSATDSVAGIQATRVVAPAPTATAAPPTLAPTVPPAPAMAPVVDTQAECSRRMAGVDAVWDTDASVAIERLQDIVSWNSSCGDAPNKLYAARVNRAQSLLKGDKAGDALTLLRQAQADNPSGGEAVVLGRLVGELTAGQAAAASADWPKAIAELSKAHAERPGFDDGKADDLLFRAYKNYGISFAAAEQWSQALEHYAAALALKPDDVETQQLVQAANGHMRSAQFPAPLAPAAPSITVQTQQEVLAAITRANNAWSAARAGLNTADLAAGLAGQELIDDTAVVRKLQREGHFVQSHEVGFQALRFTPLSADRVLVDTRETWYDEVFDVNTRQLINREQAHTYSETYTVERRGGGWIVTSIQVH